MPEQLRIFPYPAVLPSIDNVLDADDVAVTLEVEEILPKAYIPNPFPRLPTYIKALWSYLNMKPKSVLDILDESNYILPSPDEIIEEAMMR